MKKTISILVSALLVFTVLLTGCGGAGTSQSIQTTASSSASATTEAKKEPTPISIMWPGKPDLTAENDRVVAELEKRTNTKLTFISPGWDVYNDKVNISASTNELPDIICSYDLANKTTLDGWIQNGIIIPYSDEMLSAAPDIKNEYEQTAYYKELLVDGKIYYQPLFWNTSPYPNSAIMHVRKDLLDKQGIDVTKLDTLDDIYNAMKKLKSAGTYGLVYVGGLAGDTKSSAGIPDLSAIAGAYGLPYNGWIKDASGEYVYANIQPGMLDALKWLKKLFDDKLVDPDSPTLKQEQAEQKYFSGKAGFILFNGGGHTARYNDSIKKVDPNGEEYVLPAPAGPDGKRGYRQDPSFWGVTMITSGAKDPVAAAKLLDYLVSNEGQLLTVYGIEGVHYTKAEDGSITINKDERAKETKDHWSNDQYHVLANEIVSWVDQKYQDWWSFNGKDKTFIDWYSQMWANQGKYQTTNEIMITSTPKWTAFAQASLDLQNEYFTKIVLGKGNPDKLFAEYVDKWNKAGGADASIEMSDAAKKLKGN